MSKKYVSLANFEEQNKTAVQSSASISRNPTTRTAGASTSTKPSFRDVVQQQQPVRAPAKPLPKPKPQPVEAFPALGTLTAKEQEKAEKEQKQREQKELERQRKEREELERLRKEREERLRKEREEKLRREKELMRRRKESELEKELEKQPKTLRGLTASSVKDASPSYLKRDDRIIRRPSQH